MECTIKHVDQLLFHAQTGSGHCLSMDAAASVGGQDLAARPMELLLAGAGGCMSIDIVMMLKKSRQELKDYQVKVTGTRADVEPKVFTNIHFHFDFYGQNLDEKAIQRAIDLSHQKYCSASIMLGKTADLTFSFATHVA
jgi:putative redox protein